jgi:hypothetical protein
MPNMNANQVKTAWNLWKWRMLKLEDTPGSEVEELRLAIHETWGDPEKREYWEWRLQTEAKFSLELQNMGKEITDNIKADIAKSKLEK